MTDTLLGVEDLTFRGKKYAKSTYAVEKNGTIGERTSESNAREYVLDSSRVPKHIELQEYDVSSIKNRRIGERALERYLCTYELVGDELMIFYGDGIVLVVNAKGEFAPDSNSPKATFPSPVIPILER